MTKKEEHRLQEGMNEIKEEECKSEVESERGPEGKIDQEEVDLITETKDGDEEDHKQEEGVNETKREERVDRDTICTPPEVGANEKYHFLIHGKCVGCIFWRTEEVSQTLCGPSIPCSGPLWFGKIIVAFSKKMRCAVVVGKIA